MKKRILSYTGAVLFFLVLAYAFVPQVLGGKIVNQSDISGYVGMSHEMNEWNKSNPDDPTSWTSSMFSGMPTTTISAPRQGDWTQAIYDTLLTGRRPATYIFISLLGAFLLMLSLGIDGFLAAGGAVAVSFCSYNFQIIQVGHNTKMQAIAFLPWVLAACIFTYKKALKEKTGFRDWSTAVLGAVLFAFAVSFQVKANHQQITYYLALMLLVLAVSLLVWLLSSKERRSMTGRFFVASALLLVMGLAGIATNANKLIPVYKYTEQSMRGGSELSSASNSESGGLELDYATSWSYGWQELPNLMIPNFNGGSSSGAVNINKSATYSLLKQAGTSNAEEICKALPMYWGPQPFTAGPMYMGAVTVFLFILGLFFCEKKDKWWVIICTVLAVFLGLGSHFMPFTKFFYDHVPFYNKFRTVSMSLIVLQFTLPILGFMVLDRILKGDVSRKEFEKKGLTAYIIAGGFCFLFLVFPGIAGSFTGSVDSGQQDILVQAFQTDRMHALRADALRSFILISAAFILLWWGRAVPERNGTAIAFVCLLVLVDLFSVGKRYLNADDFVTPRAFNNQFVKRPVDELILADDSPSYRVLDLTVSPFNDSHPSYWHKNIGGYSPAKLQRYQELIDHYLLPEINSFYKMAGNAGTVEELDACLPGLKMLSALNMKYVIIGEETYPATNDGAYGNAWFVSSAAHVASPDEAIDRIGTADLRKEAVLEPKDAQVAGTAFAAPDSLDVIRMTSYAPNELRYSYSTGGDRLAVFSEVYYPEGWHAWLEDTGEEVQVFRADWILRGAVLPSGNHELVMRFDPESVSSSAAVSRASSVSIIILLLLAVLGVAVPGKRQ